MERRTWQRDEFILVFNLYLKTPFGKMHKLNPDVINLARLIGRSPSSVALRLVNFASCDPFLKARGIKGMAGGRLQCQPYWDEFINNQEELVFESEQILAKIEHITIDSKYSTILGDISNLKGKDRESIVRTRVNQNVFRRIILAYYNNQCALTGIDVPELLVASHIVPWAKDKDLRLNPENGICLSSLYDRAFDQGLIGFDGNYKMQVSSKLKDFKGRGWFEQFIRPYENEVLTLPHNYKPNKKFLEWHMDTLFIK
jgi:putative restriction endonuclease